MIQKLQRNLQQMKIWNQWRFLQNFPLLILTPTHGESCCKTMSINSNNFLKTNNHPVLKMIESLFRDRTVSCVRIVNGLNKYVP